MSVTHIDDVAAEVRYGFNPRDRALRPWLWYVDDLETLTIVGSAAERYCEPNYLGAEAEKTPGFAHVAHHRWKPLEV